MLGIELCNPVGLLRPAGTRSQRSGASKWSERDMYMWGLCYNISTILPYMQARNITNGTPMKMSACAAFLESANLPIANLQS